MTIYNKLVRDKIPEIIKSNGKEAKFITLPDDEYYSALVKKLIEEINEFIESDNLEEIADVLEVIEAILVSRGITQDYIHSIKQEKRMKNGGFESKIFLSEVIE